MPSVPPPPITGPLTIAPSNAAPPTFSLIRIYRWAPDQNRWDSIQWLQIGWDAWPAGYYVTSHDPLDGNVDWGPHSQVIQVVSRTKPDGSAAPYVLQPPPSTASQSPDCPAGFYLTDIGNQFGDPGPLCALYGVPGQTSICPPGFQWDPITETCKPIVPIPIPIVIPPPSSSEPPPPAPPAPVVSQPDPFGDEITYDLCSQMAANATAIINAIEQLQQQQGDGSSAQGDCCTAVVTAIGGITSTLGLIFNLVSKYTGQPPPTVTVNAPVTVNVPPAPPAEITVNAPATDVSQIVKQLTTLATQGDVDQAIFDALQSQGLITTADLQTLQGLKWSDAIAYALSSSSVRAVWKFCKQIGADADTVATSIANFANPGINFAESLVSGAWNVQRNVLYDLIHTSLEALTTQLKPGGAVSVGNIQIDPDKPLATVANVMVSLKELAMLVSLFREGAGEQLTKFAEKALAILGFEEIVEVQLGPLVRNGIAKVADYAAKATFLQEIPGASSLMGLVAQGLMQPSDIKGLLDFNGLAPLVRPAAQAAAYRGFNARQMLRLIETNLFSPADIADELTFAGMRPASQHRMLLAAPYLATASQRSQLIAAIEAAHVAGLLTDTDLTSRIDSAENNSDRDSLILDRVKLLELAAETKALENEYTTLFKAGLSDDVTYRTNLAGIGLQPWKVDAIAGVAEAFANATLQRKTIAAAAALARATAAEERKAAMAVFKSGASNAAGLAAALVLTGLTPTQAAAWVTLATLQQSGSLRWIYGLLKSPTEGSLLRARVTALADQRKRLQIDDPTFVAALQAMAIPDRYINALRAATDAMISPKTSAVTIPVQTT